MHALNFLNREQIAHIQQNFQLPVYVYSEEKLMESVRSFQQFPSAFWHTVRFAMKANSNAHILKLFNENGIKIDASSEYEVYRAINAGYQWEDIQISWQELSKNLGQLLDTGVFFVATSLHQLEEFGKLRPGGHVGVRINPWVGNGAFKAISTGWVTSAFGIWHEYIPEIQDIAKRHDLRITKVHLHIGSENTPESWVNTAAIGLDFTSQFENVHTLDMGGWFKMAIMPYEKTADLESIGNAVKAKFEDFYSKTQRKIRLEVEPGKYMVINTCSVLAEVNDIVDTGADGYTFIRLNSWMTEMPRVAMYGVQQPIIAINESKKSREYIVAGHCCESGDVLTTKLYDQETLETVSLPEVSIGDVLVIEWTGAYNASMSMKNYNSFPEVGELLIREDGKIQEIRQKEKASDIWRNEPKAC